MPLPFSRSLEILWPVRAAPATPAGMPWVSRAARIHQRWLTRTDASPSRHREVLPGKSNASDTHAKNAKRASYDDGGVGEAAQPAVSWKQAVKRRKRQKPTKKLYVRHA